MTDLANLSPGWFKASRTSAAMDLIKLNPRAFILSYVIAHRARYHSTPDLQGVLPGEALMGDYKNLGMTRQQYRTALGLLERRKFVTTKTTTRGTIVKLSDARIFEVVPLNSNHQVNPRATIKQPLTENSRTVEYKKALTVPERIGVENKLKILKERLSGPRKNFSVNWLSI